LALAAAAPHAAGAQGVVGAASEALEQRVDALGGALSQQLAERSPLLAEVARRVRISGSASGVWWIDTQRDVQVTDEHLEVWDARFFVDVLLLENVSFGGRTWLRSAGISAEWDLIRVGSIDNEIGEAYLELQGVADSSWLNAQLGRFQVPIGENYL